MLRQQPKKSMQYMTALAQTPENGKQSVGKQSESANDELQGKMRNWMSDVHYLDLVMVHVVVHMSKLMVLCNYTCQKSVNCTLPKCAVY